LFLERAIVESAIETTAVITTKAEIESEIVAAYRLLENLGPNDSVQRISPKSPE
jgi:hypothetical protein